MDFVRLGAQPTLALLIRRSSYLSAPARAAEAAERQLGWLVSLSQLDGRQTDLRDRRERACTGK